MCDFTGWRNMWIRWCLNKMCHVTALQWGCVPGIVSSWVISCFYRVEERQNVRFYRVEEHVDEVVFE